MLRRIMIIFASATAVFALASISAGAGTGDLELFSQTGYGGTQANVTQSTLSGYQGSCVPMSTLTSSALNEARSTHNNTTLNIDLYKGTLGCVAGNYITTVNANTSWSMAASGQPATYVYVL